MTVNRGNLGLTLALLVLLLLPSTSPEACSDPPPYPIFVNVLHPDYPFKPYASGRLGIIHPTYARSYLVVAYRYMNDSTWRKSEQADFCKLWEDRLTRTWDSETQEWLERWAKERARIALPPLPEEVERYLKKDDRWIYEGISADAFRTALATLKERRRQYGSGSQAFRAWVEAQDLVFSGKGIPEPLPLSASAQERADRAYQIAATQFYKGNWEEAGWLFAAIAKDEASPWRTLAPYLVVRAAVREATFTTKERPEPDLVALDACDSRLKAILADSRLVSIHPAAMRLLRQILLIRSPDRALSELDAALRMGPLSDPYQDLWDYTVLLDRKIWSRSWDRLPQLRPEDLDFAEAVPIRTGGELADWLVTFQSKGGSANQHALEMWRSRKTMPWLVAALDKADPKGPDAQALTEAASHVRPESSAFMTVQYHRARLLLGLGKVNEARSILDRLLALPEREIPPSSRNQLLSARLCTATTFEEFLRDLSRKPASICEGYSVEDIPLALWGESGPIPPDSEALLDEDGAGLLNHVVPLHFVAEAARSPLLPVTVRKKIAIAAWTRAILLERDPEALAMAEELAVLYPHLSREFNGFSCSAVGEERRNAAIFLLCRTPGLTPKVIQSVGRWNPIWRLNIWGANWWCVGTEGGTGADGYEATQYMFDPEDDWSGERLPVRAIPPFLSRELRAEGEREMRLLADLGMGSTHIAKRVLAWAEVRPQDPRIPEALHHACEALNYGECRERGTDEELYLAIRKRLFNRYKDTHWNRTAPWR